MKAASIDKNKVGWRGGSAAKQSCVFVLPCNNKGPTWPSPPSSACVVASKGPWSSSWKSRAGSLPPLQVRWEEVVRHACFLSRGKCMIPFPLLYVPNKDGVKGLRSSSTPLTKGFVCVLGIYFLKMCQFFFFLIEQLEIGTHTKQKV